MPIKDEDKKVKGLADLLTERSQKQKDKPKIAEKKVIK